MVDEAEIAASTVKFKGDEWGAPLWTFESAERAVGVDGKPTDQPAWVADVHGVDEADARATLVAAATAAVDALAAPTLDAKVADALEALPDGPLMKSDLTGVIAALQAA